METDEVARRPVDTGRLEDARRLAVRFREALGFGPMLLGSRDRYEWLRGLIKVSWRLSPRRWLRVTFNADQGLIVLRVRDRRDLPCGQQWTIGLSDESRGKFVVHAVKQLTKSKVVIPPNWAD